MAILTLILVPLAFVGFAVAFVVQLRLKHHVSLDKVRAVEDPATLYPQGIPPKFVLDERGLILHRIMAAGFALFIAAVIGLFIVGIFKNQTTSGEQDEEGQPSRTIAP